MTAGEQSTLNLVIAQLNRMENKLDKVDERLRAVEISGASGFAAQQQRDSLLDEAQERTFTSRMSRKDRIVAGIGVGTAVALGVINTAALYWTAHT